MPIKHALILPITILVGWVLGLVFWVWRKIGRIQVKFAIRLPEKQRGMIIVANHPSLFDPFLLPSLFFHEFAFRPLVYAPWSTPDARNFYNSWWWFWLWPRAVPIPRGDRRGEMRALHRLRDILKRGGRVIIFPEGGRTSSGNRWRTTPSGRRMRQLKRGVGWLALETGARILPIWLEGTDKILPPGRIWPRWKRGQMTIKVGRLLRLLPEFFVSRTSATFEIEEALLSLADEEDEEDERV